MSRTNNKIIRIVIPTSIVALLGTLLCWLFWQFSTGVRFGISYYIVVFVLVWASVAVGLFARYKPDKEKDKFIWKIFSVYMYLLIIPFVILLFFAIVMLVLMILNR